MWLKNHTKLLIYEDSKITELNLSGYIYLKNLSCAFGSLTSLDLSKVTK